MNALVGLLVLVAVYCSVDSKHTPPKVQVYSRYPGQFDKQNVLICHVTNFHPPDISIQLLQDGVAFPEETQTDLAFKTDWHFHLTRSAPFTPKEGQNITCKVTHGGKANDYAWEPNM